MTKSKINIQYLAFLTVSILIAFVIGAIVLAVSGYHPGEAYLGLFQGVFSNWRHVGDALEYAMVLCMCGLACVVASRVGIFNVGGEGQMLLGAIVACQVGVWLNGKPALLVIPLAGLAACAMGGFYAFIPGVLRVKLKVNEVITTIMLNTVAASVCSFLAKGPWKNSNKNIVAGTEQLAPEYWFGGLFANSSLSTAIFAAAAIAFIVWYVMQKTAKGFEMKMIGQNPRFAHYAGLKTESVMIICMIISGAMCGLTGMFRVYGASHIYTAGISNDYYFEALMVAMIAQYSPVPVIFLSLFFAVLKIGAQGMEISAGVPNQIYLIIQTIIIFCMAAESGISAAIREKRTKRKAKEEAAVRMKGGTLYD